MKVFEINEFLCSKFHLIVEEEEQEEYSKLIRENGGELVFSRENGVLTFASESKIDCMIYDCYKLQYIKDCIEAGRLLNPSDYIWDRKKYYGCAMSILLMGQKDCSGICLLRQNCDRCTISTPKLFEISSPLRGCSQRTISERNDDELRDPQPSTSQIKDSNQTPKSRKTDYSEFVSPKKRPGKRKSVENNEVGRVLLQMEEGNEKDNSPEKRSRLTIRIDKMSETERRKESEEGTGVSSSNTILRREEIKSESNSEEEESDWDQKQSTEDEQTESTSEDEERKSHQDRREQEREQKEEKEKEDMRLERKEMENKEKVERENKERARILEKIELERKMQENVRQRTFEILELKKKELEEKERLEKIERDKKEKTLGKEFEGKKPCSLVTYLREDQEKRELKRNELEAKEQETKQQETEEQEKSKSPPSVQKPTIQLNKVAKILCIKLDQLQLKSLELRSSIETSDGIQTQAKPEDKETHAKRTLTLEDLEENLPPGKRSKDSDSKNQTPTQENVRHHLEDPQEKGSSNSSQMSTLQGRIFLSSKDKLQNSSAVSQNSSASNNLSVLTQAPMTDQAEETEIGEGFMTEDEFINQAPLEEEPVEQNNWCELGISPILTQTPTFTSMEVDEELKNEVVSQKVSGEVIPGVQKETQSNSQDESQPHTNSRPGSSKQFEEPSPVLDKEDLDLLMDDSETDFETTIDHDVSEVKKVNDPDIEIIVKEEPTVEVLQSQQIKNGSQADIDVVEHKINVETEMTSSQLNNIGKNDENISNEKNGSVEENKKNEENLSSDFSEQDTIQLSQPIESDEKKKIKIDWDGFLSNDEDDDSLAIIADKENVEVEKIVNEDRNEEQKRTKTYDWWKDFDE